MQEENHAPETDSAEQALTLYRQAARLHDQADYATARALYERALAIQDRELDSKHPDRARCLRGLAEVLMKQGQETTAHPLLEEALAIQQEALGPEHADTAASLHTLGELLSNQGDLEQGLDHMSRAFLFRQLALGSDHPDTLESMTLMALMLAQQGERAKATSILEDALARCVPALGELHLTTARVLNGLGRLYALDEPTYARARSAYERALAIYERLRGPDHPRTALLLSNLAALLSDMEEYEQALPLLERSLAVHESAYGPSDWRTSFVLDTLAETLGRQGNHAAARPLLERALVIRERAWGATHPHTVRCLRSLVVTLGLLHEQGDEGAMLASMALYPCLTSLEKAAGTLDAADAMMPGAHLDADQAAERLRDFIDRFISAPAEPVLDDGDQASLNTARALARQGQDLEERGEYDRAVALLAEALDLQEQVLGPLHLEHVSLLRSLAQAKQGQYQRGEEIQAEDEEDLPPDEEIPFWPGEEYDPGGEILALRQRVADIHEEALGPYHAVTLQALRELMSYYLMKNDQAAARAVGERIRQGMVDALGPDDPMVRLIQGTGRLPDDAGTQPD